MCDRIVKIRVRRGKLFVDRNKVHVCKFERDQVVWHGNRSFTIEFKGGRSPFRKAKFRGRPGRPARSGPPVRYSRIARLNTYKYAVGALGARPLDPDTHVDP